MNAPLPMHALAPLRREAVDAPDSGIVEVFAYGRHREGLIPLWVGEGDLPTPDFLCAAAARSLRAGETFYTYQRGIPELRQALVRYHERLLGGRFAEDRFTVTAGGMHATQVALRLVAGAGDEVVIPTPAWPNFAGAIIVSGAMPVGVPLAFGEAGWTLDLDRLADAITPRTRALVVNTPANPTGWTASREELSAILALARRHGLWIVADEIYARFAWQETWDEGLTNAAGRTPSFHDVMAPDDRILFVQTFSKNWAMTGWRIGWLEAPPALGQTIENLIQYSTSGVPVFAQRAGVAALDEGEPFLAEQIERARRGRAVVCEGLAATGRVDVVPPPGAFYAFFRVRDASDSRAHALRLVDEANVGLAPGTAFGAGAESFMRLCFARRSDDLEEAVRRLAGALTAR